MICVAGAALVAGAVVGAGGKDESAEAEDESVFAETDRLIPERRVVAIYGAPQDEALGVLGIGSPGRTAKKLRQQAAAYERDGRPVVPAIELISTVVNEDPGADGLYRTQQSQGTLRRHLKLARSVNGILLLDIQPGHADFESEIDRIEPFLREPDVGLALDPEWNLGPTGGIPGEEFGSMEADEVNEISERLQAIVEENDLPQKLLVIHQFTDNMIEDKQDLLARPDVAVVLNVDGVGDPPNKVAKFEELQEPAPAEPLPAGFKLFYEEDTDLMAPAEVMRLRPQPDFIVYE